MKYDHPTFKSNADAVYSKNNPKDIAKFWEETQRMKRFEARNLANSYDGEIRKFIMEASEHLPEDYSA